MGFYIETHFFAYILKNRKMTSVEILQNMYGVLQKIEINTSKLNNQSFGNTSSGTNKEESDKSDNNIIKGSGITGIINNTKNLKEAVTVLPILTTQLTKIGAMEATGVIGKSAKGIEAIALSMGKFSKIDDKTRDNIKESSGLLVALGSSVFSFGKGFALGIAAIAGSTMLMGMGNPLLGIVGLATSVLVLGTTMALIGSFKPLVQRGNSTINSIGLTFVGLSVSILSYMLTLSFIAKYTENDSVAGTLATIMGSVLGVGLGMVVLGKLSPGISAGNKSLLFIGASMIGFSLSLFIAAKGLKEIQNVLDGENVLGTMAIFTGVVGSFILLYKGLAMAAPFSAIGAKTLGIISGTLLLYSISLMGISKSLSMFSDNANDVNKTGLPPWLATIAGIGGAFAGFFITIGASALLMSGLSTISPLIIAGAGAMLMMSAAIGANALSLIGTYKLVSGIDMANISSTLSSMISGTFLGVLGGFKKGLGIDKWGPTNIFDGNFSLSKLKNFIKGGASTMGNMLLIASGSLLLFETSLALTTFGLSLRAFSSFGKIKELSYDANGNPITGREIDVIASANSIAFSVSSFFNTLTDLFNDDSKVPNLNKISRIVSILIGKQGIRVFGLPVIQGPPSLLEAIGSFAEVINKFAAKKGEFNVFDKDGKISQTVKINDVVSNITGSLTMFFNDLVKKIDVFGTREQQEKLAETAELLMGNSFSVSLFGFSINKRKVGILEPVLKFVEILKLFGQGKIVNPSTGKEEELTLNSNDIVNKIVTFSSELSDALIGKSDELSEIGDKMDSSPLSKFTSFVDALSSEKDKIDIIAESMGNLADNTGKLVESIKSLDTNRFAALFNLSGIKTPTLDTINTTTNDSTVTNAQQNNKNTTVPVQNYNNINSDKLAQSLVTAFKSTSFTFKFVGNNKGVLNIS